MAGSSLPSGNSPHSNLKKTNKPVGAAPSPSAHSIPPDGKQDELDFSQMAEQDSELRELARKKSKKELEKIRKKRELEEITGKKNTSEQVDLSELSTELQDQKGGLPEHLAALPPTHPLRLRWEKGFRLRADGSSYEPLALRNANRKKRILKNILLYWSPIILLAVGMVVGSLWYTKRVDSVRDEIVAVVKKKALDLKDPDVKKKYRRVQETTWLPDLEKLLKEFQKIPRNFNIFADNPEPGSYVNYIKRHNKPFNQREAMEWRTRVIRKPSK